MRLDRFLKVSRLIKRRTLAKEACDQGRITLNDRLAKAGAEVKPGDTLQIDFGRRLVKAKVALLLESASTEKARTMYEILEETAKPDI